MANHIWHTYGSYGFLSCEFQGRFWVSGWTSSGMIPCSVALFTWVCREKIPHWFVQNPVVWRRHLSKGSTRFPNSVYPTVCCEIRNWDVSETEWVLPRFFLAGSHGKWWWIYNRGCWIAPPIVDTPLNWLVVGPPLWKIWKSIGMMIIPKIWENKLDVPNHQPAIIYNRIIGLYMPFL